MNGARFEGNYKEGVKDGHGVYEYGLTGNRYEGSFMNNKKHGRGKFTFNSGNVYEGDFLEDMRHGQGRFTFAASSNYYDGEWLEDRRHGHGVFRYSNNSTYEGGWKGGQRHGAATVRWMDGDVDSVRYERDVLVGEGIRTCEPVAGDGNNDHDYTEGGKGGGGNGRRTSLRLDGGEPVEEISSQEADAIAARLGVKINALPPSAAALSAAAGRSVGKYSEKKGSQI